MLKKILHIINTPRVYFLLFSVCFFAISFITHQTNNTKYFPYTVQQKLQARINSSERDFYNLLHSNNILSNGFQVNNNDTIEKLYQKPYGIFIYSVSSNKIPQLKYWSNNEYHINERDLGCNDSSYIVEYQNGVFEIIKKQVTTNNKNFLVVGIIPIKWDYFIKNKYLENKFDGFNEISKYYDISYSQTNLPIKSITGKILFSIKKTQIGSLYNYDITTIFFRFLGLLLLFIYINECLAYKAKKIGFHRAFLYLCCLLIFLRALAYFIPFPYDYSKLPLFDPSIYASNFLHRSLGDLWANLTLIFWLLSFKKINQKSGLFLPKYQHHPAAPILNLAILVVVSYLFFGILQSLVIDSKISFDVGNFYNLNFYSFIAFIIISILFIVYFEICTQLLSPIVLQKISILKQWVIYLPIAMLAMLVKWQLDKASVWLFLIVLGWTMLFIVLVQKADTLRFKKNRKYSVLPLFWIVIFSASVSAFIVYLGKTLEVEQRKKIAEKLYLQSDATAENLLNIATTGFTDEYLANNINRFKDTTKSTYLKDSLITENFSGYLNKYETSIYLFNQNGVAINNQDTLSKNNLLDIIYNNGKQIGMEGLYSINSKLIKNGYIYSKDFTSKHQNNVFKIFIVIQLKKNTTKGIFPDLFRQWQDADFQVSNDYAVYDSGQLQYSIGSYNFPIIQLNPQKEYSITQRNKNSILYYQPNDSKTFVVVKQTRVFLDFITLFAYLFFSFLLVVLVIVFAEEMVYSNFEIKKISHSIEFNIRSQIRATIILISSFSFIVVGTVIVVFYIEKFNRSSEERLAKSIDNASAEIVNSINDVSNFKSEYLLAKISEKEGFDFNVFNKEGTISSTTQPYIYNKKLVDIKINPIAFQKIFIERATYFKQDEQIGNLKFLSLYKPILNDKGAIISCINIPYLNSETALNQEISSFVATLMNLNAFIFLIAGAIAYFITNRIMISLKLIKDKMSVINWQSKTEEIVWERNDEIGALVNEYNAMVRKLDETAKAFAQSQKEQAWKEMAKQVAHEIKNPLTPMKLSIQYLQKSIDENSPNVKAISKTVANTLIEQIDQLTNIASDFSQFANIGNNNLGKINLIEIITSLTNLYNTNEKLKIELHTINSEIYVKADKVQVMRLFTNIIKNGIEASTNKSISEISIKINLPINNTVIISITDNGDGMSEEIQSKIFTFNFTTKSSGTGLGLAICKGIVENIDGKIWFETNNNGTIFYIKLPTI